MNTILLKQSETSYSVECTAGARFVFGFPADQAEVSRSGDDLIFSLENGASVTLSQFYSTYSAQNMPVFEVGDADVAGGDFLAALGQPELMPAAGPEPANDSHYQEWSSMDLLGGLDRLGGLDVAWQDGKPIDREEGGAGESGEAPEELHISLAVSESGTENDIRDVTFTVSLDRASKADVTVTLSNGHVVIIPAGETSASVTIPTRADDVYLQGGDTYSAAIENVTSGFALDTPVWNSDTVSATVTDDRDATRFSISAADTDEAAAKVVFTIEAENAPLTDAVVTVDVAGVEHQVEFKAGQTTATLEIANANTEDVYLDASSLTATIVKVEGGSYEGVTGVGSSTAAHIADTIQATTAEVFLTPLEDGTVQVSIELSNAPDEGYSATVTYTVNGDERTATFQSDQTTFVDNKTVPVISDAYGTATSVTVTVTKITGGNYEAVSVDGATAQQDFYGEATDVTMTVTLNSDKEDFADTIGETSGLVTLSAPPKDKGTITLDFGSGSPQTIELVIGKDKYDFTYTHGNVEDYYIDNQSIEVTASLDGGGYKKRVADVTTSAEVEDVNQATPFILTASPADDDGIVTFTVEAKNKPLEGDTVTVYIDVNGTEYHGQLDGEGKYSFTAPVGEDYKATGKITKVDHEKYEDVTFGNTVSATMNVAPEAEDDHNVINEGDTPLAASGSLLGNDSDIDAAEGESLSITGVTQGNKSATEGEDGTFTIVGKYGTLTVNADGTYSYQLDADNADVVELFASGNRQDEKLTDSFDYSIVDAGGKSDSASLNIDITPDKFFSGSSGSDIILGGSGDDAVTGDPGGSTYTPPSIEYPSYNVAVVMDISTSMRGDRIEQARASLVKLFDEMADHAALDGADVNASLTVFNRASSTHEVGSLTEGRVPGFVLDGSMFVADSAETPAYFSESGTLLDSAPSSSAYYTLQSDAEGNLTVIRYSKSGTPTDVTSKVTTAELPTSVWELIDEKASINESGTNYQAALTSASDWLKEQDADPTCKDYNDLVLFVTDGEPYGYTNSKGSYVSSQSEGAKKGEAAYDALLAANEGVTVTAIGLQLSDNAQDYLNKYDTSHKAEDISDASELGEVLSNAFNEFAGHLDASVVSGDEIRGGEGDDVLFGDALNADFMLGDAWKSEHSDWTPSEGLVAGGGLSIIEDYLAMTLHNGNKAQVTNDELRTFINENASSFGQDDTVLAEDGKPRGADDSLFGDAGDDLIFGQGGNDFINGGAGSDTLYGGSGSDIFVYDQNDALIHGGSGIDILLSNNDSLESLLESGKVQDIELLVKGTGAESLTSLDALAGKGITVGEDRVTLSNDWVRSDGLFTNETASLTIEVSDEATIAGQQIIFQTQA